MARSLFPDAAAAMNDAPVSTKLSEFVHRPPPPRPALSSRAAAGLLTAVLYALFALLAWRDLLGAPVTPPKTEIIATLLSDVTKKREVEPLPPFMAHLIRPRAEAPALPVITIDTGTPPHMPMPLPASAAQSSPMLGGTAGNGTIGQGASGNGTNGNGAGLAGCLDPDWMRAVTDRVRQVFYYPGAALALRTTGVVTMHFAVRRNGQIDSLKISKSSGDAGLDKAAYDIMQKAQPLPPIPDRMHTDRVDGELPINFGVRSFSANSTSAGHC
jgi:protein TonB